jgi:hypothetical protein
MSNFKSPYDEHGTGSSKRIKSKPRLSSPDHPTGEAGVQDLYDWSALPCISADQPKEVLSILCSAILLLLSRPHVENGGEYVEGKSSALRQNGVTLCLEVCKKHLSSLDFFFEDLRHSQQIISFARSADTTNQRFCVLHFVIAFALQKLKCPAQMYQRYFLAAKSQYLPKTLFTAMMEAEKTPVVDSQMVVCGLLASRCYLGMKEDSHALSISLLCEAWCKAWCKENEGLRLDEMLKEALREASCCVVLCVIPEHSQPNT